MTEVTRYDRNLIEFTGDARRLVDAQQLADLLGVTRGYVYEHKHELGALPLGSGPKARLRFDVGKALEWLNTCSDSRRSDRPQARSVRRSGHRPTVALGTTVELLPIRGRSRAVGGVS